MVLLSISCSNSYTKAYKWQVLEADWSLMPSSTVQGRGGWKVFVTFLHIERETRISSLSHLILNSLLQQIQPLVSGLYDLKKTFDVVPY